MSRKSLGTRDKYIHKKFRGFETRDVLRPFITREFRQAAFNSIHALVHPSTTATRRPAAEKFVWPSMNKACVHWYKTCVSCQQSKADMSNP